MHGRADDTTGAVAASITFYLETHFIVPSLRDEAGDGHRQKLLDPPAALMGPDCAADATVALELYVWSLIDASHRYMLWDDGHSQPSQSSGKRQTAVAFVEEPEHDVAGLLATRGESATLGGSSSDSETADDTDEMTRMWARHFLGAEAAVEAIALLRLLDFDVGPAAIFKTFAAAMVHSTLLICLRAATAAMLRATHPYAQTVSRRGRTEAPHGHSDMFSFFAFHCGLDDDALSGAYDALVQSLPPALQPREARALDQYERAAAAAACNSSRRDSTATAGSSSTDALTAADGTASDAEDSSFVMSFFFVLAGLGRYDASWSAWVPERTAAAQAHHTSRHQRRQQSFIRRASSFSSP